MRVIALIEEAVRKALDTIHALLHADESMYLLGGAVRDIALGRPIGDVDLFIQTRRPDDFRRRLDLEFSRIIQLHTDPVILRIPISDHAWLDVQFGEERLETNLAARDFTINAMALPWPFEDFSTDRIDPFGGWEDLRQRRIRVVREKNLTDDPLRMIRAYRMAAELEFDLIPSVRGIIRRFRDHVKQIAGERIAYELLRWMEGSSVIETLRQAMEDGLLGTIIPELKPTVGCEQGGYHHLDVWGHTLAVMEGLRRLVKEYESAPYGSVFRDWLKAEGFAMGHSRHSFLMFAALLHDIGKPAVRKMKGPGRYVFHGHEHSGTRMVRSILEHLRFSRRACSIVTALVRHHLEPLRVMKQQSADIAAIILIRRFGVLAPWLALLSAADQEGKAGPLVESERRTRFRRLVNEVFTRYFSGECEAFPLRGEDLMKRFGFQEGIQLGRWLKEARRAWEKYEWTTKEEGLAWLEPRIRFAAKANNNGIPRKQK